MHQPPESVSLLERQFQDVFLVLRLVTELPSTTMYLRKANDGAAKRQRRWGTTKYPPPMWCS